jgi:hypothetical protein
MPKTPHPAHRAKKFSVAAAKSAMAGLIPEIERLAARYLELGAQLEAKELADPFGRPGREHLRLLVSGGGESVAELLLDAAEQARFSVDLTQAKLLANWKKDQKKPPGSDLWAPEFTQGETEPSKRRG